MRKNITFSFEVELIEQLKRLSEETMIPQSRLVEQAIKKLIDEKRKPSK